MTEEQGALVLEALAALQETADTGLDALGLVGLACMVSAAFLAGVLVTSILHGLRG